MSKNKPDYESDIVRIEIIPGKNGKGGRVIVHDNVASPITTTKQSEPKSSGNTRWARHLLSQFYADPKQPTLFSDDKIDAFAEATGLSINNKIKSYGVELNESQNRVFEAIVTALSNTNYKGNEQTPRGSSLEVSYEYSETSQEALVEGSGAPYQNIPTIPVVKLTQGDIIRLAGYSRSHGDKTDVDNAIKFLATKQFCFYWKRLKYVNGIPVEDKAGNFVLEEVMEVGTLLRVKWVKDEGGTLKYYEIHPSAPMLEQADKYFLIIPNNWRDEVKEITGKRTSRYTLSFLPWLRVQFEIIRQHNSNAERRNNKKRPFEVRLSWEEVAIALKMPYTMYRRNRKEAVKVIKEAYSIAIELGYLVKVESNGATDTLYLNEDYYPKPGQI